MLRKGVGLSPVRPGAEVKTKVFGDEPHTNLTLATSRAFRAHREGLLFHSQPCRADLFRNWRRLLTCGTQQAWPCGNGLWAWNSFLPGRSQYPRLQTDDISNQAFKLAPPASP